MHVCVVNMQLMCIVYMCKCVFMNMYNCIAMCIQFSIFVCGIYICTQVCLFIVYVCVCSDDVTMNMLVVYVKTMYDSKACIVSLGS